MSGLAHVARAVAITVEWAGHEDRPAPGETMTAFKKRRRDWRSLRDGPAVKPKPTVGQAKLEEALPGTLRTLMRRGRIGAAQATAAAKFMVDYRTGFLSVGSVSYAERVDGGGGWDEERALSGQTARERAVDALACMGAKPGACVKAVLIEGVSLSAAGSASGYADGDQQRSYAVALLETGLDALVKFYA